MQTQGGQIKFHLLDEGEAWCHFNIIKTSYLTFLKNFSPDAWAMKKSIEASTNQSLLANKIISTNLTLNIIFSYNTLFTFYVLFVYFPREKNKVENQSLKNYKPINMHNRVKEINSSKINILIHNQ